MAKKKTEQNLYLLAIVAIVAIVGIVVLIFNAGGGAETVGIYDKEENFVGLGFKQATDTSKRVDAPGPTIKRGGGGTSDIPSGPSTGPSTPAAETTAATGGGSSETGSGDGGDDDGGSSDDDTGSGEENEDDDDSEPS